MSKKQKILDAWDCGIRDVGEITRLADSTNAGVRTVLSQEGRTRGRMSNGPLPSKGPKAVALWEGGERDLGALAKAVGSTRRGVSRILHRYGVLSANELKEFADFSSFDIARIPKLMVQEAERRGQTPRSFAQRLLLIIAEDELYAAVLDDS